MHITVSLRSCVVTSAENTFDTTVRIAYSSYVGECVSIYETKG